MKKVTKAIFPVAGLGTRFLPATKSIPKEIMTLVDRPLIQYAIDEARAAGIKEFIFVTSRGKGALEDYFDHAPVLEQELRKKGKEQLMEVLKNTNMESGAIAYIRQHKALGLGHAVWCARDIVGDEPFAVLLPDMVMDGEPGCLKQMMDAYEEVGGNIISLQETSPELTHKYGIVSTGAEKGKAFEITGMVEKPAPGTAPSNLYINGRYILQPKIMELLSNQSTGAGGEIQLTDAMLTMMESEPYCGVSFNGRTYDCGSKFGFLEANIMLALKHDDVRDEVKELIASLDL